MRICTTIVAAGLLASFGAKAQTINGVYVGLGAGANLLQNEQLRSASPGFGQSLSGTHLRFDPGYRALASVGYGFGNGIRVEVEGDYFHNGISGLGGSTGAISGRGLPSGTFTARGDEEKFGGFVNALFDIDPSRFGFGQWLVTPYVGAGIGYLQTHNQNVRLSIPGQALIRSTGSDGNLAYQGIVGLALPIEAVPGLALTFEYRFTGVTANRSPKGQFFAPGIATGTRLTEGDDLNHSLLAVAVRYEFNHAPPPSLVPVSVPTSDVPQRTYLVFFDWDRADLTNRARQIIAEAATASTRVQTTRIEVQGNADRSGSPAYNQQLSLRRARVVAAELVRHGVPSGEITVQGFGDTRPLVPTAAGVREPQNRRVEIILR